jgi:MFS family permease
VKSPTERQLRANVPKIMIMNAGWMFLVIMPVVVPFYQSYGLTMERIFQLQTIFALCVVTLEVPTGYVADLLGRRRCIIAAALFYGLAFTTLALSRGFAGFVVFEVLAALATSLFSGTDVALLYDSLEAAGERGASTRLLGRKVFYSQIGETVAALLGGGLALLSLRAPVVVNAIVCWLPLAVAVTLVEPPRARLDRRHHLDNARLIGRVVFGESHLLRLIVFNLIAYGLATLLAVWAFQGYWLQLGVGLGWFGLLWAAYNLTVALAAAVAHRVEARLGAPVVVLAVGVLPVVGYAGMAVCGLAAPPGLGWAIGGIVFGLTFQVGRGLNQVINRDALNVRVPTELRATANSLTALGVRLAFAFLGPLLGWLIDGRGYPPALGTFAVIYAVVLAALCVPLVVVLRRASRGSPDHRGAPTAGVRD